MLVSQEGKGGRLEVLLQSSLNATGLTAEHVHTLHYYVYIVTESTRKTEFDFLFPSIAHMSGRDDTYLGGHDSQRAYDTEYVCISSHISGVRKLEERRVNRYSIYILGRR